ncbi:hypothetical protein FOIG_09420 [Fusarium odoratissimum NRRL 54006]|uniref:Uncharacterized protein n=2 Tax=Fusarium oxysporum species complex TaxID=171631 RepID=X0JQI7_FUSO5|nr:uncharacterized protein FOIG_09420 [Fusarium odoratissimum NRRL 54006]EXL98686.1 hypothetical protein FOIG_09420 [Fusarium odoratissimum NRRL 54006]TXC01869.1 hypothetical protein FocTR4_00008084 [Fusarium oxysporum f. sp. cubense]
MYMQTLTLDKQCLGQQQQQQQQQLVDALRGSQPNCLPLLECRAPDGLDSLLTVRGSVIRRNQARMGSSEGRIEPSMRDAFAIRSLGRVQGPGHDD